MGVVRIAHQLLLDDTPAQQSWHLLRHHFGLIATDSVWCSQPWDWLCRSQSQEMIMQNIIANKEASDGFSNSIERPSRCLFLNWQRSLAMLAPQHLTWSHMKPWIGSTFVFFDRCHTDVIIFIIYWCSSSLLFGAHWQAHIRKVRSLFTNLDADDSGYISLKELEENIDKKSATGWKCWDIWGDVIWDIWEKWT